MESIEFRYCYNEDNEVKTVAVNKNDVEGLHDYEVCELFLEFMNSVGFSEENVYNYFCD